MEPLEKGGGGVMKRTRGIEKGEEEEESRPVPLRGMAVHQKALFITGEEDKDTQKK